MRFRNTDGNKTEILIRFNELFWSSNLCLCSLFLRRSPRLRHEIRKPRHSSVDNLTNEISYITETEDVFYTYKGSPTSKDSDSEFSQNRSPQRR